MAAVPVDDLGCLDETSIQITMTRSLGRAPVGVRLTEPVPPSHGENQTLLAAIGVAGGLEPLMLPRALDGEVSARWVRDRLVPLLHPGWILVLDNLSVHKNAPAGMAIAASGCEIWPLPVYSPDLNPIESVFADLKAHLRGANAQDPDTLPTAIGAGLDRASSALSSAEMARSSAHRDPAPACR